MPREARAPLVIGIHSVWTVATLPERDDYHRVLSKWQPPSVLGPRSA